VILGGEQTTRRGPTDDFDHSRIPDGARSVAGFPQQRHVLDRLRHA